MQACASPKGTRVIVRDLFLICQLVRNFFGLLPQSFPHPKVPAVHGTHLPKCSVTFTSEKGVIWHVPPQLSAEERFYSLLVKKPNFVLSQLRRANWTFI